ncbi:MAG TPA: carbohydrate ABC transporter substrate-binding protein [Clostridiaceae bacterium]|nr:carbohydrate ABC transporter substrate-binding protein [Clostridiaceae bacterium]
MKKFFSILLIVVLMVTIASCGSNSKQPNQNEDTTPKTEENKSTEEKQELTTITLPTYRAGEDVGARFFIPQVERFNKEYEGKFKIIIEESPSNTHTERIKQLALQDKLPAIFQVPDSKWVEDYLIANKKLYNLKDWIESKPELKKLFIKESLEFCTKEDGGVYALPLTVLRPTGLYYNPDKIKPNGSLTQMSWDQFSDFLGDQKIAFQTAEGGWTVNLFLTAIIGSLEGGPEVLKAGVSNKITDFNTPLFIEAFTILQKLFQKNGWSGAIGATYPDAANSFYANQTAILPDGTWIIDKINDPTDWANGFDGSKVVGDYYPGNVAIANPYVYDWMMAANLPKNEEELALAFFEFINRPEEIEAFILAEGGIAPNLEYSESFKQQLSSNKLLTDFAANANPQMKYVPYFHDAINASLFTGDFSNYLPNLYNGSWTPEKFAQELTKSAKALE